MLYFSVSQPNFCSFRPRLRRVTCRAGGFLSAIGLLLLAPFSARAQTTTYTSQSAFLNNVQAGYYLENFNTGVEDNASSYNFSSGGFAYTVTAGTTTVPSNVYQSGTFIGTLDPARILTFTFSSGNVTAVGGNFFHTDSANQLSTTQSVTVRLSDGTSNTFTPTAANSFRGFTTTAAITSLSIAAPTSEFFASADDFIVGRRIGAVDTPEPGSLPLALSGLAAVGAWCAARFRKRNVL